MFSFFKRSKSRIDQRQQKNACATNELNREKLQKPVEEKPIKNVVPTVVSQSLQQLQQYEHESIGERASSSSNSNSKNGFFDIMAKGKNRRNNGKTKYQQQQQQPLKQKLENSTNKANGQTKSFTDRNQQNNNKTTIQPCDQPICTSKPQSSFSSPPSQTPAPSSSTTIISQKPNNENNSVKLDSNNVENEKKEIYDDCVPSSKNNYQNIENNYNTNTIIANKNNELATNCVHDNDNVRHFSDKNSEQKQYGDCVTDNDYENGAADFIKGIIFEKYKRPISPIYIRPTADVTSIKLTNIEHDDTIETTIMGQQPTKVQNLSNNRPTKYKSQSSITSYQASTSPPTTPNDEKDIFYEAASDNIPTSVDRFPFNNNSTVSNNNCSSTFASIVSSENFNNCAKNENNHFSVGSVDDEPRKIVSNSAVANLNYNNDDNSSSNNNDDCRHIVINNDANLSIVQEKLNNNENDSPDSGIHIDISDISQVIDKLQQNEHTNSSNSSTNNDTNCFYHSNDCFDSAGGGGGCEQSAFNHKENLENSNDDDDEYTSYENCENDDNEKTPAATSTTNNVCFINSNVNIVLNNSNENNHKSSIKHSDDKKNHNLQKKRVQFEDTISLPDIIESTGNGIVIMNHNDEENHNNDNGIVDKISTVGQTNGIEK